MATWTHGDLIMDLTRHLADKPDLVTVAEFTLGSTFVKNHPGRADVATLKRSYGRMDLTVYEVKVQLSDLNRDLSEGKYTRYFDRCHRLYFAIPAGLAPREKFPADVGLITRGESGWSVVKAAKRLPTQEIPNDVLQALAFSAHYTKDRLRRADVAEQLRAAAGDRQKLWDYGKYFLPRELARHALDGEASEMRLTKLRQDLVRVLGLDGVPLADLSDSGLVSLVAQGRKQGTAPDVTRRDAQVADVLYCLQTVLRGHQPYRAEADLATLRCILDLHHDPKTQTAPREDLPSLPAQAAAGQEVAAVPEV